MKCTYCSKEIIDPYKCPYCDNTLSKEDIEDIKQFLQEEINESKKMKYRINLSNKELN